MSGQSRRVLQFPKLDKETLAFIKARLVLRSEEDLLKILKTVQEVVEYKRSNKSCPKRLTELFGECRNSTRSFSELAAYQFLAEESGEEIPD